MIGAGAEKNNTYKYEAPVAGASGGTLLALVANSLPDTYEYKHLLILIAPIVSVALSSFWTWSRPKLDALYKYISKEIIYLSYKRKLLSDIKNPINEEHKKDSEAQLEILEEYRRNSYKYKLGIK